MLELSYEVVYIYTNAQSNLGLMYMEGFGVTQDFTEAVKWFRKAADQGNVGV